MLSFQDVSTTLRDTLRLYWLLIRIVLPVMVLSRVAVELGLIDLLAPLFAPLMVMVGLPPELGFAWLASIFVGIWAGAVAIYSLVPMDSLTTAQVTIASSLLLFAHAMPVEQRIVQKAGPSLIATSLLRLLGGLFYAFLLHTLFEATGWLQTPVAPHWVPASKDTSWFAFVWETAEALLWMFVILLGLVVVMKVLRKTGLMDWLTKALAPVLRIAGIGAAATPLTMVGLLLGLAYGGGLIIEEARKGHLEPRDIFLSTSFMGLAHSLIEDTLLVVALGADLTSVFVGRLIFAIAVIALLARVIDLIPKQAFFRFLFKAT